MSCPTQGHSIKVEGNFKPLNGRNKRLIIHKMIAVSQLGTLQKNNGFHVTICMNIAMGKVL